MKTNKEYGTNARTQNKNQSHFLPFLFRHAHTEKHAKSAMQMLGRCSLYKDLRKNIKPYFWKRPNVPTFEELMTSENRITIRN